MNSYERLKAMTEGKPVDRPACSGWCHFAYTEMDPVDFPRTTINVSEAAGYDLVKIQYNAFHFCEDYGQELKWWPLPPVYSIKTNRFVLNHPKDFLKLKPLDPKRPGSALNREIEATKKIVDHFKGRVPVLATMFNPYTQAGQLYSACRPDMLREMMEYSLNDFKYGLDAIHETNMRFADALIEAGVDGVFYATMYAFDNRITEQQYQEVLRPYDLDELNYINSKTWLNMLHLHGGNDLMFKEHLDYPVQAINWEDITPEGTSGAVTMAEARQMTDKILVGGMDHRSDLFIENNNRAALKERLKARARAAIAGAGKDRLIFAPGCGFPQNVELIFRYPLIKEALEEVMEEMQ